MTPKFELGRDLCTMHLTDKFHHPTFDRSELIVLTNKQTPLKTSTSLRYTIRRWVGLNINIRVTIDHCVTKQTKKQTN